MKNLLSYTVVSLLVSGLMLGIYHYSGLGVKEVYVQNSQDRIDTGLIKNTYNVTTAFSDASKNTPANFRQAAEIAMPAVVHIKSVQSIQQLDPFYDLFGMRPRKRNSRQQVSTGSGVIISSNGYIVTNNHVIKGADNLTVTLHDNRTYEATVIGTDPTTDLGLIKIEAEGLNTVDLMNSDEVVVGEWVLAVGNPFSLASTATAGIVSAIGRDLDIIQGDMTIESFIQTDAAVNPGNSGGALVNLEGKLIGINTAIASPTGAYAGYAFAVPSNIVKKVVADLKEFGNVQRAFLGITYSDALNGELAKKLDIDLTEGVLLNGIAKDGGAYKAGLKKGDVVVSIDGIKVKNDAKMLELIGRNRPGDVIQITVYRNKKYKTFEVQLTDKYGKTTLGPAERNTTLDELGLRLEDLDENQLYRLGLERGVMISSLFAGKLKQETELKEGFIITKINDQAVSSSEEVIQLLNDTKGKVSLVGTYPGYRNFYEYTFER
ncbi:MAG: trypsin-like peptidase domain-containing protein [Bacteroidia bacterium]|nr:trypsin-like peptidase domain-containing protein [Bacteroidia bacterium]